MITLTLAEVAAAVDGALGGGADPATEVTGQVVADSRQAGPGGLFVAFAGERADGHDHVPGALAAGAVAALVQRPVAGAHVLVADPLRAVGALAREVVRRLTAAHGLTVVGVTGSAGKTTTKDLMAAVFEGAGPTVAPQGSFNNELGLPLTALRCDPGTRYLVAEMGSRGLGHLTYLCDLVAPGIGVVLNVGTAHVGEFGDVEVTARAKGELVEALPGHGTAVLNADDPRVRAMASRTRARVLLVGRAADAHVRATDVRVDDEGRCRFTVHHEGRQLPVHLGVVGAHQVSNALCAIGAGLAAGLGLDEVVARVAASTPRSRWRMERARTACGALVLNDAYNANPDSVASALETLAHVACTGRRWAVLGEMLELGATSAAEHDALVRRADALGVDELVSVGTGLYLAGDEPARTRRRGVADHADAAALLRAEVHADDVVLVKASRGVGLERVVDLLAAPAAPVAPEPGAGASAGRRDGPGLDDAACVPKVGQASVPPGDRVTAGTRHPDTSAGVDDGNVPGSPGATAAPAVPGRRNRPPHLAGAEHQEGMA